MTTSFNLLSVFIGNPSANMAGAGSVFSDAGSTAESDAALGMAALSDPAGLGSEEQARAALLLGRGGPWTSEGDVRRLFGDSKPAAAQFLAALKRSDPSPFAQAFAGASAVPLREKFRQHRTNGPSLHAAGTASFGGGKTEQDPLAGKKLGNYLIGRRLGRGGMAAVYEASHVKFGWKRAVKIVAPEYASDPTFSERFMREALLTKEADHRHIVGYEGVEWNSATDSLYLVMEYLKGETLETALQNSPMPWERTRGILLQILEGLEAMHRKEIVHRDLKPDNIMLVEKEGQVDFVIIFDLGIAKPVAGSAAEKKLTAAGLRIGTPHYMSPEQAQGEDLGARSDLYTLGIIMYEILTGILPFDAATPEKILIQQATELPLPPTQKNPDANISKEVEAVILHALKKDPAERFQNAQEMAEAIRKIEELPKTIPAAVVERFSEQGDVVDAAGIRKRFPWKGVGAASALLAVGLGGYFLGRREETTPEKPELESPGEVVKAGGEGQARGNPNAASGKEAKDAGTEEKQKTAPKGETPAQSEKPEGEKTKLAPEVKESPRPRPKPKAEATRRRIAGLIGQLGTEDEGEAAYKTLLDIGRPAVPALITALLKDESQEVRRIAAHALGKIGDKSAVPALITALLKDESQEVRRIAAIALRQIGDRSAVPALITALLKDESQEVRRSAASALGSIGDKSAVPALEATLKDKNSYVSAWAASALGKIGDKSAVPALEAALKHEDVGVRTSAAIALEEIGDRSAVPALEAALKDENFFVRAAAAEALEKLQSK